MISCASLPLIFFSAASSTLALAPPSSGPAINIVSIPPQSNNSVLPLVTENDGLIAVNASLLGTPYAAPDGVTAEPQCDGDLYGNDIKRESCLEALGIIDWPAGNPMMSFGDRAKGLWDNQLPIRWQSCESNSKLSEHTPWRPLGCESLVADFELI